MGDITEIEKQQASAWFHSLRDQIVSAFETLESAHITGPFAEAPIGQFDVTETKRSSEDGSDAGGGLMSVMRNGRVFEKVGVNVSTVYGRLGAEAQKAMAARMGIPGMQEDPRFWAAGISLVAHLQNPHCPAVHMNTRMFWTPHAWWFGGGSDLNPCIEYSEDTAHFHATQKAHLDPHDPALYAKLKLWADEYFYIPHRKRARGVGRRREPRRAAARLYNEHPDSSMCCEYGSESRRLPDGRDAARARGGGAGDPELHRASAAEWRAEHENAPHGA